MRDMTHPDILRAEREGMPEAPERDRLVKFTIIGEVTMLCCAVEEVESILLRQLPAGWDVAEVTITGIEDSHD